MHIELLPAFDDNYIFLLRSKQSAAVVDPGDARVVANYLQHHSLTLTDILLTHHHPDHIGGVKKLVAATGAKVTGAAKDAGRLPPLDQTVEDGDLGECLGATFQVLEVSGHTLGHIVYYFPTLKAAFVGDTLFNHGCGRMFEGEPKQFWQSLTKIRNLPPDTKLYCAHEYTLANMRFARYLEPESQALIAKEEQFQALRAQNLPTVPMLLAEQIATNPFLRCDEKNMMQISSETDPAKVFAFIRRAKDNF